jgi:hypothetical protein
MRFRLTARRAQSSPELPTLICAAAVVTAALVRRSMVGIRAVDRASHLADRHCKVSTSDNTIVFVPVKGEPDQAEASARWWAEQGVAEVWFVTSETEQPPLTRQRLAAVPGTKVFREPSANKAGQLNDALDRLHDEVEAVAFFDSDSRPSGNVNLSEHSLVTIAPSLYRTNFSSPHRAFAEGLALAQTVWSLGFEASMGKRRRLWYTVGHGLIVDRSILGQTTFDETLLVEDLGLGYRLSPGLTAAEGQFTDTSLFFASAGAYFEGIGRWFIGDLQAVLRQGRTPLVMVRAIELVTTWLFGPALVSWALFQLALADRRLALAATSTLAAMTVVPAELVRRRVWPRLGIDGGYRRAMVAGFGVLARPYLDMAACTFGTFQFAFKENTHETASKKPPPPVLPIQNEAEATFDCPAADGLADPGAA